MNYQELGQIDAIRQNKRKWPVMNYKRRHLYGWQDRTSVGRRVVVV
jgi:hypothetical protein